MPAFPWLYRVEARPDSGDVVVPVPGEHAPEDGQVVATEEARALVAYLQSLRQPELPSARDTAAPGQKAGVAEEPGGARVYASRCSSCHQPDGQGVEGVYPPLAGDPVVTADDPTRHVQIVLFGLQGKSIGGVSYPSAMPAWGDRLSNEEVAAVVNHERTSWGNDAPTVTAEDVAEIREEGASDGG